MKNLKSNKLPLLILILAGVMPNVAAGQQDSIAQKEIIKLHYFNSNNSLQYLVLESLLKKGKQTEAQKGKEFKIFLDKDQPENLVAKLSTDNNGKAKAILPPELKNTWDSAAQHTFLVVSEANSKEDKNNKQNSLLQRQRSQSDTSSRDGTKIFPLPS